MQQYVKIIDILEAFDRKEIDILIHQTNCFNTWGAGLAKQMRQRFPRAYESDCMTRRGDPKKLGQFTFAIFEEQIICNLYGQYRYGRDKQYTDYDAFLQGCKGIRSFLEKMDRGKCRIGFPHGIGAGLAGGDFKVIDGIIRYVFKDSDFSVVYCKLPI